MTENFKSLPEHIPVSGSRESLDSQESVQRPELPISLELPPEIASAIAQRMSQSGQTQTQVILEALSLNLQEINLREKGLEEKAAPPYPALEELEQLKRRLAELETLIPKVAMLEGKSIAF